MQIALPEINKDWLKLADVAQKWVDSDAKNSDAWYELGVAQENLNQLTEAKKSFEQSTKLDPSNIDSLFRIGVIAQTQGDKVTLHNIQVAIANIDKDLAQQFSEMLGCGTAC